MSSWATNAGNYYVYYKVIGDGDYGNWGGDYDHYVVVSIAKVASSMSATPTAPAADLIYERRCQPQRLHTG